QKPTLSLNLAIVAMLFDRRVVPFARRYRRQPGLTRYLFPWCHLLLPKLASIFHLPHRAWLGFATRDRRQKYRYRGSRSLPLVAMLLRRVLCPWPLCPCYRVLPVVEPCSCVCFEAPTANARSHQPFPSQ